MSNKHYKTVIRDKLHLHCSPSKLWSTKKGLKKKADKEREIPTT